MDLKARLYVNFAMVDMNLQMGIATKFRNIFFTLISLNTKVPLILQTKFQPNIPSHSGEKVDFNGYAIFSTGSHLGFLTRLNFTSLSLIMLQVKFEIHRCSGFIDAVVSEN